MLLLIACSTTSGYVYAQEALISSVPLDELPNDFDHEEVYRLDTMFGALSAEIIEIYSPHLLAEGAALVYGNSDPIFSNDTLRPISVEAKSENDYRWRAVNKDHTLEVTVLKKDYGFAGSVFDHVHNTDFRIFPLGTNYSVLLEMPEGEVSCTVGETDDNNDSSEPVIDPEDYEGEPCPGHVDILFMIPQAAQDWLNTFPDPYLDNVVADLRRAFENSEIVHSLSYQYVYVDYNQFDRICKTDAETANADVSLINELDISNADIGVLLAPPSFYNNGISGAEACVAKVGPNAMFPIAIIPVDICLVNHIFSHEVGHLFGGEHNSIPGPVRTGPTCAAGMVVGDLGDPSNRETIMSVQGGDRIRHFSNPNINYLGFPTGSPNNNNANYINLQGCILSDFNIEAALRPLINVTESECMLDLSVDIGSVGSNNYTFQWYWNTTGFFLTSPVSNSLGTGQSLSVNDPYTNPCEKYFIHVKILENGVVVASKTITQQGGICTDNVTCGNSGGGNLVVSEEFIEQNQLKHFIVNSLGVVVSTVWSPNSKISSLSLVPGIYFHVIIDSNGQIESSPFIISSNY